MYILRGNYENHLIKLRDSRRIVIKVGTSSLTDDSSKLDVGKIANLVSMIMRQKSEGKTPILVSSGAIGAGLGRLEIPARPTEMDELQAAAAIGQGILMQTYEFFFNHYDQPIAQILLTNEDFTDPCRYSNLSKTIETLLKWGVIPIINENDTVATDEIKVGDNDTLASHVTIGVNADLLIILTDVDGLYNGTPGEEASELVKVVPEVTPEVESWASRVGKGFGGMYTKVKAAQNLASLGIPTVIANSKHPDALDRIFTEQDGTLFLARRPEE
ncbi:glutamate 5-kinase [Candidatus Bathyarchaeota archaeon]|nr:glutamate 5-kinase [Candidatus Bathyarchaeota archaeon]